MADQQALESFRSAFRAWLDELGVAKRSTEDPGIDANFSVAVFDDLTPDQEAEVVRAGRAWEARKYDNGWGAVDWPAEFGGCDLPHSYAAAVGAVEDEYILPRRNELFAVTQHMIAPTIREWGTPEQVQRFVRPLLRTDLMACQLFSEPDAGSDLAAVRTRAVREGDEWVLSGQKIWSSMATSAQWGEAICRSDPDAGKHAGITAFLVPMYAPGVIIRPIRQMTGGSSFNEVFLDQVRIPDALRLGPEGSGWAVALTTLAAERSDSRSLGAGTVAKVVALARRRGVTDAALVDGVVDLWVHDRVQELNNERTVAELQSGRTPGPQGSIGKLAATINMRRTSDVVSALLGEALAADTGDPATFAWCEQVLGAPGYRIAGGSDEIQRNIIAERVLGLPRG
ncbi:MAG: fadE22 [Pseudonocardiales bacterium]|nr:fadE22 [Pseudonocardiales bacterium]